MCVYTQYNVGETFKLYHGLIKAPSQTSAARQTNHILQYHAYMSCDYSQMTLLDMIASHRTASHHPHRAAQIASPTLDRPHHIACIAPHHSYCIANIAPPTSCRPNSDNSIINLACHQPVSTSHAPASINLACHQPTSTSHTTNQCQPRMTPTSTNLACHQPASTSHVTTNQYQLHMPQTASISHATTQYQPPMSSPTSINLPCHHQPVSTSHATSQYQPRMPSTNINLACHQPTSTWHAINQH